MTIDQTATEISLSVATTEALEQELKDRSEALSRHQARFAQVRDELKRRRETKDEQPLFGLALRRLGDLRLDHELGLLLVVKTIREFQQAYLDETHGDRSPSSVTPADVRGLRDAR